MRAKAIRWAIRGLAWLALIVAVGGMLMHAPRGPGLPPGVRAERSIGYTRVGGKAYHLDLYRPDLPPQAGGDRVIIALHGGGWSGGSRHEFGPMSAELAAQGFVVLAIDYPLARPGRPSWPEALEAARAAVRWAKREAPRRGFDPEGIGAVGASAGGHLALLLGSDRSAADGVAAVVALYAPTDPAALWHESPPARRSVELLFGAIPEGEVPEASAVARASRRSAPTLLIHGSDDAVVPPAQAIRLDERLDSLGVDSELELVPGARHGFGWGWKTRQFLNRACQRLDFRDEDGLR